MSSLFTFVKKREQSQNKIDASNDASTSFSFSSRLLFFSDCYCFDWHNEWECFVDFKKPLCRGNIQLGFIRFWTEPQPLFFVNIPSIILRPDKYNRLTYQRQQILKYLSSICKTLCHDESTVIINWHEQNGTVFSVLLSVVYFKQQRGTLDAICWSKMPFNILYTNRRIR